MPATGSENFDDKEEKKIPKFTLDLNNNEYDTPEEESPTEEKDDTLPFTFTSSEYVISTPDDDPVKQKESILTNNSSQLSSPNLQCVHEEFSSSVPNHLVSLLVQFSFYFFHISSISTQFVSSKNEFDWSGNQIHKSMAPTTS